MGSNQQRIVVIATPTSPLLPYLLHSLLHESSSYTTLLTRETSITIEHAGRHSDSNQHKHTSTIDHHTTDFSTASLTSLLEGCDTLILNLTGAEIYQTQSILTAASTIGVKHIIPSEFGLDTDNSKIRELLPPHQRRYEIQQSLQESAIKRTAIYGGVILEEGIKVDGVLGIDPIWHSATFFPDTESTPIPISTYKDLATTITAVASGRLNAENNAIYFSTFKASQKELVTAIESIIGKKFDWYEGDLVALKQEAKARLHGGYFDGGVALMQKAAVWDGSISAWDGWVGTGALKQGEWENLVGEVLKKMKEGEIAAALGCGC